jgi:hypothetical protein
LNIPNDITPTSNPRGLALVDGASLIEMLKEQFNKDLEDKNGAITITDAFEVLLDSLKEFL